jgi:hypothetical protein
MEAPQTNKPTSENEKINLWDALKGITLYLGVLLFFIGWVYLSTYFRQFGFSTSTINVEVHDYYIYGFYAIRSSTGNIIILSIAALFCLLLIDTKIWSKSRYTMLPILCVVIFPVSYYFTSETAIDKANELAHFEGTDQTPSIYISLKESFYQDMLKDSSFIKTDSPMNQKLTWAKKKAFDNLKILYSTMRENHLVEIYQNKDEIYVFANTDTANTKDDYPINTYMFNKKDVSYYTFQTFQTRKK